MAGTRGFVRCGRYWVADLRAQLAANARGIAEIERAVQRHRLDSGQAIVVRIDINQATKRVHVDFTGTSAQDPHNFNAPRAVCMAAVLYVFRTLIDRHIPLNEGCLALLANHRRIAPFGVEGGTAGVVGGGRLLRATGETEEIGATAGFKVEVGDVLTILTPGGGGFGAAGG
jgi:N-methylhydantoinase B/oxoprolinase/acetone carboxylase alpha subunit